MDFRGLFSLFQINPDWFRIDTWFTIVIVIVVIAFTAVSVIWGIRAHHKRVAAGSEDLVGREAVVDIVLDPKGVVLVEGERWRAILDKGRAEPEEDHHNKGKRLEAVGCQERDCVTTFSLGLCFLHVLNRIST